MRVLNRRFVLRYLILIAFLALCAGAAWYLTGTSDTHAADTVLARKENHMGKYAVVQKRSRAESALWVKDDEILQEKVPAGYGILHEDILSKSAMPRERMEDGPV